LAVGSGQGPGSGIFGGKISNSKYLMFPKKRDNLFGRRHNIPDRKGTTKEGHLKYSITVNKWMIAKDIPNERLVALIFKGY